MSLMDLLEAAGNALDVPSSVLRDLVGGQGWKSFDQLRTPFSSVNRLTGRDLLRKAGWAGQEDTWGNAAGGMALEMLLDPVNLISGAGLIGKALKGAKFAKATRAVESVNRYAGAKNLAIERAKRILSEYDQSIADIAERGTLGVHTGLTDKFVDLSKPSTKALGFQRYLADIGRSATPQQLMDISYGPRQKAAEAIAASSGETLAPLNEEVRKLLNMAHQVTAFGYRRPQGAWKGFGGLVVPVRPDLMFLGQHRKGSQIWEDVSHEAIHNMARMYPKEYRKFQNAIGKTPLSNVKLSSVYNDLGELERMEEQAAKGYGQGMAALHGIDVFPPDPVEWSQTEHFKSNMATGLRSAVPMAKRPIEAASQWHDFMSGEMARRRALVPVGETFTREAAPRSFFRNFDAPYPMEEMLLSEEPYMPMTLLPARRPPRYGRDAAALSLYNTLRSRRDEPPL